MDIIQDPNASYKLLSRELKKRGFIFHEFNLSGMRVISHISPRGKAWLTRADKLSYPLNTGFHASVVRSKALSYALATHEGFSVAHTEIITDESLAPAHAEALIKRYGRLIVKPESASLSRGLTLNITTPAELIDAVAHAKAAIQASSKILIQQQIIGEEVRFIVINGHVVGALLREKPKLVGDGARSLEDLLAEENESRSRLTATMVTYPLLTPELFAGDIDLTHVPKRGEIVELNQSTMIRNGASIYNVLDQIHPTYVSAVEAFVQSLGAGFVATDVFIEDYMQPMTPQTTHFNEFNNAPVLKLCYSCRDGNHIDIVPLLVDAIDKRIHA